MTNQVFMSPNNGQLVLGIPLFRVFSGFINSQSMKVIDGKPAAYMLYVDKYLDPPFVASADWVKKKLINLGDL